MPAALKLPIVAVQSLSCAQLFVTPGTSTCQAYLSFTISQSLLGFMSIVSMMPSNHLIVRCPLLLLPSIFPSIRVFSTESALHSRWPKCWSFGFSISPSNEYSGLISFRIDCFDLPVQGTLKSLLQQHSSKPSIRWYKPRQHIKKQGHHFANKGPSSQRYGFSSSHVWM